MALIVYSFNIACFTRLHYLSRAVASISSYISEKNGDVDKKDSRTSSSSFDFESGESIFMFLVSISARHIGQGILKIMKRC